MDRRFRSREFLNRRSKQEDSKEIPPSKGPSASAPWSRNGPVTPTHAHACADIIVVMRTTVEIADEHRARLLELAARRREKGFSRIVSEAIEQYLQTLDRAEADRRKVLKLRGSLSPQQAENLETEAKRIRNSWR